MPTAGWVAGAGTDGTAGSGPVLFGLALLVVAAKVGGLVMERWGPLAVLGELFAGIGLVHLLPLMFGGQGLAFVRGEPTLQVLAEIGVLILPFDVGLESDLRAFARIRVSSALVALIGVVVPLAMGWAAAA